MSSREQAIQLKMQKARSMLSEAEVLMENRFYETVINRLYYGCFHATKALLLTKDLTPKTHSGVINLLHQHFVQPGLFDMEQASFYSRLMQQRMEDDYSDQLTEDADTAAEFIEPAKEYLLYVERIVMQYLQET
jgi:uncharacterized protein (UPF0332 family)